MAVRTLDSNISSLRICSYNSRGHRADRLDYIKDLMTTCDMLCVQEHWLLQEDLHKLDHNDCNVLMLGVSGMDSSMMRQGRPFGGCAMLYKRSWNCSISAVTCSNNRICACVLSLPSNVKCIIINVYMPCDQVDNVAIYHEVLNDIESLIATYPEIDNVIICGDFNTDMSRLRSLHTRALSEFCARQSLTLCVKSSLSAVDFTYQNSASNAQSIIDHFIVSKGLSDAISQYECLHDGQNLSDHCPVLLRLNMIVVHCTKNLTLNNAVVKPAWFRASARDLQQYKHRLQAQLNALDVPTEALHCNQFECTRHLDSLRLYYNQVMDAVVSAASSCIPRRRKKAKAGWSEHVKPLKADAVFWHRLWVDSGRPRDGWVHAIMTRTRAEYKKMSRWVIRNQEQLAASRMADALSENRSRDLWTEVKRIRGSARGQPNVIDEAVGDEEVCELFHHKYEELYQSVASDENKVLELQRELSSGVREKCQSGLCYSDHRITYFDVKNAVKRLKSGKSDENAELSSDHFIHACDEFFVHLVMVCF